MCEGNIATQMPHALSATHPQHLYSYKLHKYVLLEDFK